MFSKERCEDQAHLSEAAAAVTGWIDKCDRMPEAADGDDQGCVLVWHRYQGVMVMNVRNVQNFGAYITHWMRMPEPPEAADS